MILVTVGAHYQPFDRLLLLMDALAPTLKDDVIAQTGTSRLAPRHMNSFAFAPRETLLSHMKNARLMVAHAGVGTILDARRLSVPLVIFPRRKAHHEHNNDHQLEIANQLKAENRAGIKVALEEHELIGALTSALLEPKPQTPPETFGKAGLINELQRFLEGFDTRQ